MQNGKDVRNGGCGLSVFNKSWGEIEHKNDSRVKWKPINCLAL